ncbi:lipopolysaccharide biosynthesis protein [Methylobacterium sp. P31]
MISVALVLPFALVRELSRQVEFAHLRVSRVLVQDACVAALQLGGLAWLSWRGALGAGSAIAIYGVAAAIVGTGWILLRWNPVFPPPIPHIAQINGRLQKNWRVGRWLFAGQLTVSLRGYCLYLLLALSGGMESAGVFAACFALASITNPVVLALANILTPRATVALAKGGQSQMIRECIKDTALLVFAVSLVYVLVLCLGDEALRVFFPRQQFAGHGDTVAIIALALSTLALGLPPASALTSMKRANTLFVTTLSGTFCTLTLTALFAPTHGAQAAACGMLVGAAVSSTSRWVAIWRLLIAPSGYADAEPAAVRSDESQGGLPRRAGRRGRPGPHLRSHRFWRASHGLQGDTAGRTECVVFPPLSGREVLQAYGHGNARHAGRGA